MDERYRNLASVVVIAVLVTTMGSLMCPHGWPVPTGLLLAIATLAAMPIGWLARNMFTSVAAAVAVGVAVGAPFIAPITLTLIALVAMATPSMRRS